MRPIWIFLISLQAMLLGFYGAKMSGVSTKSFITSLVGTVIGMALLLIITSKKFSLSKQAFSVSIFALICTTLTFLSSGFLGVHRWVSLGGLQVNASAALAPLFLWGFAKTLSRAPISALFLLLTSFIIHGLQPDAGQATAIGCAAILLLLTAKSIGTLTRFTGVFMSVTGIVVAWKQPDPLPAVEHVEHAFKLVVNLVPMGTLLLVLSLALLTIPLLVPLLQKKTPKIAKTFAGAIAAYWIATLVVTEFGNFPAPILGAGASPIIGWYLLVAIEAVESENGCEPSRSG
jgi:hypothetical protein